MEWVLLEAFKTGMTADPKTIADIPDREWRAGISAANRVKAQIRAERKRVTRERRTSTEK